MGDIIIKGDIVIVKETDNLSLINKIGTVVMIDRNIIGVDFIISMHDTHRLHYELNDNTGCFFWDRELEVVKRGGFL